jgi:hypothetical protein
MCTSVCVSDSEVPAAHAHLKCVASSVCAPRLISHSLTAQQSATPSEVEVARPSSSINTRLRGPALRVCHAFKQMKFRVNSGGVSRPRRAPCEVVYQHQAERHTHCCSRLDQHCP